MCAGSACVRQLRNLTPKHGCFPNFQFHALTYFTRFFHALRFIDASDESL